MIRGSTLALALLASIALGGATGVAAEEDLTGTYVVTGKNADGSPYSGTATITGTSGGECWMEWSTGQTTSVAFCIRQGDVLGAAYRLGDAVGIVIYRIGENGVLDGTWSVAGQEGVGEEQLTPQ